MAAWWPMIFGVKGWKPSFLQLSRPTTIYHWFLRDALYLFQSPSTRFLFSFSAASSSPDLLSPSFLSPSLPLTLPVFFAPGFPHSSCARQHQRRRRHHWQRWEKCRRASRPDWRQGWRQQSHPWCTWTCAYHHWCCQVGGLRAFTFPYSKIKYSTASRLSFWLSGSSSLPILLPPPLFRRPLHPFVFSFLTALWAAS